VYRIHFRSARTSVLSTIECTVLYCTSDSVTSLKVLLSQPRTTTLYRTSQHLSVLLHIYYTRSLSRLCPTCTNTVSRATTKSPSFYQDRLCPTRTNFVSRVYRTVRDPAPLLYNSPVSDTHHFRAACVPYCSRSRATTL
jgi:hypothetical protein